MAAIEKIFISYSWKDGDWVWKSLIPVLKAAGSSLTPGPQFEVLYDRERFEAGEDLESQEEKIQAEADEVICVLSQDYLESTACQREMKRAIRDDNAVPVICPTAALALVQRKFEVPEPLEKLLYISATNSDGWDKLLQKFGAEKSLGVSAAKWIEAGREVVHRFESQENNVNLVIKTDVAEWRALLDFVIEPRIAELKQIDLDDGETSDLQGLGEMILERAGLPVSLPKGRIPAQKALSKELKKIERLKLALLHFDRIKSRERQYGEDFFGDCRTHSEAKRLRILAISRASVRQLLPASVFSKIPFEVVEL